MPVDHSPPTPAVRPIPHIRKLAFAGGALLTILAIYAIRAAVAL